MCCRIGLSLACCSLFALTGCGGRGGSEFVSSECKFKVVVPGKVKQRTEDVNGVPLKVFAWEEKQGGYSINCAEMPIAADESVQVFAKMVAGVRNALTTNLSAKITAEDAITLNEKHTGREIQGEIPNKKEVVRVRVYLANNRFYQLMVMGKTSWATRERIDNFFASFQVID